MRRKLLILAAVLVATVGGEASVQAQNRLLTSGNGFFSITNFGPGPATLSNMTGLPLGTFPEGNATGELALKVLVVNGGANGGGTQRTPTISTASSTGTVAAGAKKLTLVFSSDFAGTVLGAAFSGAADKSIDLNAPDNDTLAAVAYTVSAGSIRIIKVQ